MKAYQTAITALGVLLVMLITAFAVVMTMLVAADTPRPPLRLDLGTITLPATVPCPTEDSCTANYHDGAWHIERSEP